LERRERLFRAALDLFARKASPKPPSKTSPTPPTSAKALSSIYFPSKEHILLAFAEMQLGSCVRCR